MTISDTGDATGPKARSRLREDPRSAAHLWAGAALAMALSLVVAGALFASFQFPQDARYGPTVILSPLLLVLLVIAAREGKSAYVTGRGERAADSDDRAGEQEESGASDTVNGSRLPLLGSLFWVAFFGLLLLFLGAIPSAVIFSFCLVWARSRRVVAALIYAIVLGLSIYALFEVALGLGLFSGYFRIGGF